MPGSCYKHTTRSRRKRQITEEYNKREWRKRLKEERELAKRKK